MGEKADVSYSTVGWTIFKEQIFGFLLWLWEMHFYVLVRPLFKRKEKFCLSDWRFLLLGGRRRGREGRVWSGKRNRGENGSRSRGLEDFFFVKESRITEFSPTNKKKDLGKMVNKSLFFLSLGGRERKEPKNIPFSFFLTPRSLQSISIFSMGGFSLLF